MEAYKFPPTFVPEASTFASYISLVAANSDFLTYYKNNYVVSFITALVTTGLAVFAGYALSRFKYKWNNLIISALIAAQIFPVISRLISLYTMLKSVSLLNTHFGLICALIAASLPFSVILMVSFFDSIPKSIEQAAFIDGASRLQILFKVVMPLTKPGLLAVGIYTFLLTWDDYLHAVTLITSDNLRTLSTGIALRYLGELSYDWSLINTISVVGTLPMMLFFFFFQKYMVQGLTAGAVKG